MVDTPGHADFGGEVRWRIHANVVFFYFIFIELWN